MDVRPATRSDLAALRAVARRSWEHDYPEVRSRETVTETVAEWYGDDRLRDELADPDTDLLVAVDGEVVGFAHVVRSPAADTAAILRLYVDPPARDRGVGETLLDHAVQRQYDAGVDRVEAMALAQNDAADGFYRAAGFEHDSTARTRLGEQFHEERVYVHRE
jgi:ribosomal protein S18 acetylase RimI-like enzyme